jgi:Helix-turn-helix domain
VSNQMDLIEAYLRGQIKIKVWDSSWGNIFRELSPSQFKLWFYLWSQGNDEHETWQSLDTMENGTDMSRHTVIAARKYLLEHGWLVATGGTAADKYNSPTRGASQVLVYRAVVPAESSKLTSAETAPVKELEFTSPNSAPVTEFTSAKFAPNVSGSDSGSDLGSASSSGTVTGIESSSSSASCSGLAGRSQTTLKQSSLREENQKPTPIPKPTPTHSATMADAISACVPPSPAPVQTQTQTKRCAKDGTTYPPDFNSWTNQQRLKWLEEHKRLIPLRELNLCLNEEEAAEPLPEPPPALAPAQYEPKEKDLFCLDCRFPKLCCACSSNAREAEASLRVNPQAVNPQALPLPREAEPHAPVKLELKEELKPEDENLDGYEILRRVFGANPVLDTPGMERKAAKPQPPAKPGLEELGRCEECSQIIWRTPAGTRASKGCRCSQPLLGGYGGNDYWSPFAQTFVRKKLTRPCMDCAPAPCTCESNDTGSEYTEDEDEDEYLPRARS